MTTSSDPTQQLINMFADFKKFEKNSPKQITDYLDAKNKTHAGNEGYAFIIEFLKGQLTGDKTPPPSLDSLTINTKIQAVDAMGDIFSDMELQTFNDFNELLRAINCKTEPVPVFCELDCVFCMDRFPESFTCGKCQLTQFVCKACFRLQVADKIQALEKNEPRVQSYQYGCLGCGAAVSLPVILDNIVKECIASELQKVTAPPPEENHSDQVKVYKKRSFVARMQHTHQTVADMMQASACVIDIDEIATLRNDAVLRGKRHRKAIYNLLRKIFILKITDKKLLSVWADTVGIKTKHIEINLFSMLSLFIKAYATTPFPQFMFSAKKIVDVHFPADRAFSRYLPDIRIGMWPDKDKRLLACDTALSKYMHERSLQQIVQAMHMLEDVFTSWFSMFLNPVPTYAAIFNIETVYDNATLNHNLSGIELDESTSWLRSAPLQYLYDRKLVYIVLLFFESYFASKTKKYKELQVTVFTAAVKHISSTMNATRTACNLPLERPYQMPERLEEMYPVSLMNYTRIMQYYDIHGVIQAIGSRGQVIVKQFHPLDVLNYKDRRIDFLELHSTSTRMAMTWEAHVRDYSSKPGKLEELQSNYYASQTAVQQSRRAWHGGGQETRALVSLLAVLIFSVAQSLT